MPAITRTTSARIPTAAGQFQLCHYANEVDEKDHLALVLGEVANQENVLVRVHSECFTGDVLGSLRCDCGEQLSRAMEMIAAEGSGVIVYLRQEGRGIGLKAKLQSYNLQDEGYDTVEANLMLGHQADEREYWAAAGILADLKIKSIRLMTNNPTKIERLTELGVTVKERVGLTPSVNQENAFYLDTKVRRMRHMLALPQLPESNANQRQADSRSEQSHLRTLRSAGHAHFAADGRPYVTLSYAQSIDGSIALRPGERYPISGPASMRLTHGIRANHDAILVGVGTVLADNPRLDVRLVEGTSPAAVILDSHLRTPIDARLFYHHDRIFIVTKTDQVDTAAARALCDRGATIVPVPTDESDRIDLEAMLEALGTFGIRNIMVEGGAQVIHSFLEKGVAHYAVITVAPFFLNGLTPYPPGASGRLPAHQRMTEIAYEQYEDDLVIWGALGNGKVSVEETAATRPEQT